MALQEGTKLTVKRATNLTPSFTSDPCKSQDIHAELTCSLLTRIETRTLILNKNSQSGLSKPMSEAVNQVSARSQQGAQALYHIQAQAC